MQSAIRNEIKFVLVELIGDAVRFPIWWYTTGLKKTGQGCINSIVMTEHRWGLHIWVKNIFVPYAIQVAMVYAEKAGNHTKNSFFFF